MKKSTIGDILKLVIFIGIGVFFIYWSFHKLSADDIDAFIDSFHQAHWEFVGIAMLVALLSHLVRAARWTLLFKPLGLKPRLINVFGSVMVAYMANLAFPRLGEVLRCAMLRNSENIPMEKSLGTVVTERVVDVFAFGCVVLLGLLLAFGTLKDWLYNALLTKVESLPSLALLAGIAVALFVIAVIAYRVFREKLEQIAIVKKVKGLIVNFMDGLKSIFHMGTANTILFVVLSLLIYFLYILGGWVIFWAFDETVSLPFMAAFMLYLFGSVGMTVSQGGIGAYPYLVQQSLNIYLVSVPIGLACGWMLWGSQQVVNIVFGMVFLIYFSLKKKKHTIEA